MAEKVIWQRWEFHQSYYDRYALDQDDDNEPDDYRVEYFRVRRGDDGTWAQWGYVFEVQRFVEDMGHRKPEDRPWSRMTEEETQETLRRWREEYLGVLERNPRIVKFDG